MKYFSNTDFQRANPPCKMSDMNQTTLHRFDHARELAGIPFIVNSAYRTVEHEKKQGRAGTSAHTTGHAIDIRAVDGVTRFKVVKALIDAGFNRIGVAQTFIHADDSPTHPPNVLWFY
jgi:uncharacterized protein YcbK (DUF882 family)